MSTLSIYSLLLKAVIFTIASFAVAPLNATAGVDKYEVFLNDKLIIRHSLDQPLDLKDLLLTQANINDKLTIKYTQCNAPAKVGKNRSISLRDRDGRIVKEWKFKDSENDNASMTIPVKEILEARSLAAGALVVYYSADGLIRDQMLAGLPAWQKRES